MNQPKKNQTYKRNETTSDQKEGDQPPGHQLNDQTLVCIGCGALRQNGKWSWNQLPNKTTETVCPACTRIKEQNAAGTVILTGDFVKNNREELVALITNVAASELAQNPLERLIGIQDEGEAMVVSTTGVVIARHIGYALNIAFQGRLETTSNEDDHIHVIWNRDS